MNLLICKLLTLYLNLFIFSKLLFRDNVRFSIYSENTKIGVITYNITNLIKTSDYYLKLEIVDASNYSFGLLSCEMKFIPSFKQYHQNLIAVSEKSLVNFYNTQDKMIAIMDTLNGIILLLIIL